MAIVVNNEPNTNPEVIIPIADKKIKEDLIPLVLISMENGNKIMQSLNNDEDVIIAVDFEIPYISEHPSVIIWMSPLDPMSYKFLIGFKKFYQDWLYKSVNLKIISRFEKVWNIQLRQNEFLGHLCYSKGNFCVGQSNGIMDHPLQVLDEGIR